MTLHEAQERLCPLPDFKHQHARADGSDLVIEHHGDDGGEGWTFAELEAVAAALGVRDIDITSVFELDSGLPMERLGGGCPSCGHGDMLVVRGILETAP